MSRMFDFYCGPDVAGIAAAVLDPDPGAQHAEGLVEGHADFTLGISADELEDLVSAFSDELRAPRASLFRGVAREVVVNGDDFVAVTLKTDLVRLLAMGSAKQAEIGHRWLEILEEDGQPAPEAPTSQQMLAIEGLIMLCQTAVRKEWEVLYVRRR